MTIRNYKELKTTKDLAKNIDRTNRVVHLIYSHTKTAQELIKNLKERDKTIKVLPKSDLLNKKEMDYIFELGFITLYSNFEFFMYELIKELINKFPRKYESEKIIAYDEIKEFKTTKEVKEYFVDSYAINKTKTIEEWNNFLIKSFDLDIFGKNKKDYNMLCSLKEIRNLYLHSGSKTNSLFRKNMKKYTNITFPLNSTMPITGEELFHVLINFLNKSILKNGKPKN
jgi:hypothetical protein